MPRNEFRWSETSATYFSEWVIPAHWVNIIIIIIIIIIVIIIIIIIIILFVITYMQVIYKYISETKHFSRVYSRGSQTFLVRGTLFRYAKYSGTSLM